MRLRREERGFAPEECRFAARNAASPRGTGCALRKAASQRGMRLRREEMRLCREECELCKVQFVFSSGRSPFLCREAAFLAPQALSSCEAYSSAAKRLSSAAKPQFLMPKAYSSPRSCIPRAAGAFLRAKPVPLPRSGFPQGEARSSPRSGKHFHFFSCILNFL